MWNASERMTYAEFLAAGHPDGEWEDYAEARATLTNELYRQSVVARWKAGEELQGNDLANILRRYGKVLPPKLWQLLQHEDTAVSATSAAGRGMDQREAKALHKAVSLAMASL